MNKILPQEQGLFPVCFKRKLEYQGHFIRETIDKNKVDAHFKFLQTNHPGFFEINLKEDLIDEFCLETRKAADMFESVTEITRSEPKDEFILIDDEDDVPVSKQYPSLMMDKYEVDFNDNTVAGKLACMILEAEISMGVKTDDIEDEFKDFLSENELGEEDMKTARTRAKEVVIAPGEDGKFQSWC